MESSTTTTPLHESCVTDADAPTFDAEWERRAFGVAVALSEFGHYPWDAFQQRLISEIGFWETTPEPGDWQYYDHWLAALERVLVDHGLVSEDELRARLGA
ncbi:nitrile hydratase accessory protein [Nocardia vinacea]|uniref:nitrile hydratase accessory protein n=1 Tax=Nocardia vinacea TaxID=96468 RepID=UPI002E0DCD71|nr:nitrile hydratase accessory protein [Nocardia vinacea]